MRCWYGWAAFTGICAIALPLCAYLHLAGGAGLKIAASCGFLGAAICAGALHRPYGRVLLAALVLSWWGDVFLIGKAGYPQLFLLGLAAFLLAHVAYAGAFLICGVRFSWSVAAAAVVAVPSLIIEWWLRPHLGTLRYPVYAYIVVISIMAALAFGVQGRRGNSWVVAGAVLFYCSDFFVARQRFVEADAWNVLLGLPLYYGAQLLFTRSIFHEAKGGGDGPPEA